MKISGKSEIEITEHGRWFIRMQVADMLLSPVEFDPSLPANNVYQHPKIGGWIVAKDEESLKNVREAHSICAKKQ